MREEEKEEEEEGISKRARMRRKGSPTLYQTSQERHF